MCVWDEETQSNNCNYTSEVEDGDYYIAEVSPPTSDEATSSEICAIRNQSDCSTFGDYWNAAKKKCEDSGSHLANLAELRAVENDIDCKTGYGQGDYWAAEASTLKVGAWHYCCKYQSPYNDYHSPYYKTYEVVCVGNY